jgi:hypothetical protein
MSEEIDLTPYLAIKEVPLVPPQTLGELCLELLQGRLVKVANRVEAEMTRNGMRYFSVTATGLEGAQALRRFMWHRDRDWDDEWTPSLDQVIRFLRATHSKMPRR